MEGSNREDFQIGAYDKNTNTIRVITKKTNISSKDHITNTVTITATGKDGNQSLNCNCQSSYPFGRSDSFL